MNIQLENANKQITVTVQKVQDHKQIMMLIASQEVAGLCRLLAAALRQGCSAQAIISLIQCSIDGLYTPWGGFSNRDLDIAFLVKAIGGPLTHYRSVYHREHTQKQTQTRQVRSAIRPTDNDKVRWVPTPNTEMR